MFGRQVLDLPSQKNPHSLAGVGRNAPVLGALLPTAPGRRAAHPTGHMLSPAEVALHACNDCLPADLAYLPSIMDGDFLRLVRRRTGLTQRDLAAWLDVDQGTVSRWECGKAKPRPSTVANMRALLLKNEEQRVRDRSLAIVRNNLLPATLMDSKLTLKEFSGLAVNHYRQRSGTDLRGLVGSSLEVQASRSGYPELWDCVRRSGLLDGDAIVFSFAINSRGKGHVTVCEPFLEDGRVSGFLHYVGFYFDFPKNAERTLEFAQVVRADDPEPSHVLYRGQRAEVCERLFRPS